MGSWANGVTPSRTRSIPLAGSECVEQLGQESLIQGQLVVISIGGFGEGTPRIMPIGTPGGSVGLAAGQRLRDAVRPSAECARKEQLTLSEPPEEIVVQGTHSPDRSPVQ